MLNLLLVDSDRRFLLTPVLFSAGIGVYFGLKQEPGPVAFAVVLGLCLSVSFYFKNLLIMLFAVGFCHAALIANLKNHRVLEAPQSYVDLEIEVDSLSETGNGYRITGINAVGHNREGVAIGYLPAKMSLSLRTTLAIRPGDTIRGRFNLYPPPPWTNAARMMWFEGVGASGFSLADLKVTGYGGGAFIADAKRYIAKGISDDLHLGQRQIALALVLGERGRTGRKLTDDYRNSGIAHLLSVSGMHMTMIAFPAFWLARFILALFPFIVLRFNIKKAAALSALAVSALYLGISGAAIPTMRAFIMVAVSLTAILLDRRAVSLRNIAIAALLILIYRPESLITPSFQMSFAVVAVLIALYEDIDFSKMFTGHLKTAAVFIASLIVSTFAANLASALFSIYYFNRIPLYSQLTNLAVLPIFSFFVMPVLLFGCFMLPFGLSEPFLKFAGFFIEAINDIAALIVDWDGMLYVREMPFYGFIGAVLAGVGFVVYHGRKRLICTALFILCLFSPLLTRTPDFIIDESGELWAVKDKKGGLLFNTLRKNRRTRERWALKAGLSPQEVSENRAENDAYFAIICNQDYCSYRDFVVANSEKGCIPSRVLIDIDWVGCKNQHGLLLNRHVLAQNGAYSFRYRDGGRLKAVTDRESAGRRLWNLHRQE